VAGWEVYDNFCVSSSNQDLSQTNWGSGDASIEVCKSICQSFSDCSAIEWYNSGWDGSKCKLMLGSNPATHGSSGGRWQDAECHVNPRHGSSDSAPPTTPNIPVPDLPLPLPLPPLPLPSFPNPFGRRLLKQQLLKKAEN